MHDPTLDEFVRDQRDQLVGQIGAYCGDPQLAEDLAQEALARAAQHWNDLQTMDAPGAWLHRVAMNLTNSHYRRRRTDRRVRDKLDHPHEWTTDPDPALRITLVCALETLPARQRAAVALRYLLDWSVADVADVLGTNENTVKSLTHRGIHKLRDHFDRPPEPSTTSRTGAVIGIVALVVAAIAAATIALRTSPPDPVYIDTPEQAGHTELPPGTSGAHVVITGDLTDELTLPGIRMAAPTDEVVDGRSHLNERFTDGHSSLIIRGHANQPSTHTGNDLRVSLVLGRSFFESTSGECTVTLNHVNEPFDGPSQPTEGVVTCHGLGGNVNGEPHLIDLRATFRIPAPSSIGG